MARTEDYLVDHSGRSVRTAGDEDGQMIAWRFGDLRPTSGNISGPFSIWLDRAIGYSCPCLTRAASDAYLDKVCLGLGIGVSSAVWLEFTTSGHQSTCRNIAYQGSLTLGHFQAGAMVLPRDSHPKDSYCTLTEDNSLRLASLHTNPRDTAVTVCFQCYSYYCRRE
ncbi:uncharacterized protein BO88DRAFT_425387 [Aspergillus vadensis CBS 113365]|uniref:Uncharacterized protein n=1 Tax=Aspergillus vadensis (strain CBS 113365 / IMI 142717 / IBT 24658) TaxID=1448311 RepID=A0A319BV59_ASPVC|nr:hypothetical protein BO88DRAFT_425387 [Aspergillus vadensis CBS 113365]PYH69723.1 hypothetical protein BO88DRAFT_425387 [Aspergillus vadensis CBS 113365]